ncbi:UNG1 [Sanghuangporus vaninii]
MSETTEQVVYLEDLEVKSKEATKENQTKDENATVSVAVSNTKAMSTTTTGKRQRTLMEMTGGLKPKEPTVKKQKLDRTASSLDVQDVSVPTKSVTSGLQTLNSIPFSMQAFKDSLTEEQKELLNLELETMGKSWLKVLKDEFKKPYFISLKKFLWSEGVKGPADANKNIFPAPSNIYAWSKTPLGRVRVVIVGQDPYHTPGMAHGLCFSVPRGQSLPPSLLNIYKEIKNEYPEFIPPKHGNLTAWANSGVLLLNSALTVRSGAANSHKGKGWESFTEKVIDIVDRYGGANLNGANGVGRGVVFLCWGKDAAKRVEKLDKKKHLILQSAHPSPLSASRGFFGNGHFKKANTWLETRYGKDGLIDWCTLDPQEPESSQ